MYQISHNIAKLLVIQPVPCKVLSHAYYEALHTSPPIIWSNGTGWLTMYFSKQYKNGQFRLFVSYNHEVLAAMPTRVSGQENKGTAWTPLSSIVLSNYKPSRNTVHHISMQNLLAKLRNTTILFSTQTPD
jgi:hypothetical protein